MLAQSMSLLLVTSAFGFQSPLRKAAPLVRCDGSSRTDEGGEPLKMLMIHGFTQNGTVFEKRMKSAVKKMFKQPKGTEYVYVDAPHQVSADRASPDRPSAEQLCWFNVGEEDVAVRPVHSVEYRGWEASLELLNSIVDDEGPFHGVCAFSQGTALAAMLLAQRPRDFDMCCMIGGMGPKDPAAEAVFDAARGGGAVDVRSLHVIGTNDPFVSLERAEQLADCFVDAEMAVHDGGHIVPPNGLKAQIRDFCLACLP